MLRVERRDDGIAVYGAEPFDLEQTLDCGQCFRFVRTAEGWSGAAGSHAATVFWENDVLRMRAISETVRLDDAIIEYIVRLVEATRHNERIQVGSSMRGALALTRCARVWAASSNRGYVVPDDVKQLAVAVLAHRITLTAEATFAGSTPEQMIEQILNEVPSPTVGATA